MVKQAGGWTHWNHSFGRLRRTVGEDAPSPPLVSLRVLAREARECVIVLELVTLLSSLHNHRRCRATTARGKPGELFACFITQIRLRSVPSNVRSGALRLERCQAAHEAHKPPVAVNVRRHDENEPASRWLWDRQRRGGPLLQSGAANPSMRIVAKVAFDVSTLALAERPPRPRPSRARHGLSCALHLVRGKLGHPSAGRWAAERWLCGRTVTCCSAGCAAER